MSVLAPPDRVEQARAVRWDRRSKMWRFAKQQRHQTCGRAARGDAVFIDVSERADGTRHASARGLVSCSSVWCCPVCSAHIRAERAGELAEGVSNFRADGGTLLFLTLTVQHQRGDALADLLDAIYAAWRKVQQSSGWRTRRERLAILGFVRALEVTFSKRAGWHPHVHLLLFVGGTLSTDEVDELRDWTTSQWIKQLRTMGRDAVEGPAVDLRRVTDDAGAYERLAGYTVKGETIHLEVARSDIKQGRWSSLSPLELLDAAADGETWALQAWWEYEASTSRRRAIEWSRGLRALVGLAEHERDDAEIVEDAVADAADVVATETVAVLSPLEWVALASAGLSYRALEAAAGNVPGVHLFDLVKEAMERWHTRRRERTGGP